MNLVLDKVAKLRQRTKSKKPKRFKNSNGKLIKTLALAGLLATSGYALKHYVNNNQSDIKEQAENQEKRALHNYKKVAEEVVYMDVQQFVSNLQKEYYFGNFPAYNYCIHVPTKVLKKVGEKEKADYIKEILDVPNLNLCSSFVYSMNKKYPGSVVNPHSKKKIDPHSIETGDILILSNGGRTESGNHAVTKIGELHDKNGDLVANKIMSFNNEYEAYYLLPGKTIEDAIDIPHADLKKKFTKRNYVRKGEIGVKTTSIIANHIKLNEIMQKAFMEEFDKILNNEKMSEQEKTDKAENLSRKHLGRVGALDHYLSKSANTKTNAFAQNSLEGRGG